MKPMEVADKLKESGLRPTAQRVLLGGLLWGKGYHRHLTAEQLHTESRHAKIKVSLATVYNTLHQFTDAGLLREIVVEGGSSYFDTNIEPHHHFLNEETGMLTDIPASHVDLKAIPHAPHGTEISRVDVIIRIRPA